MDSKQIYFMHGYKGSPENFGRLKKYFPTATFITLPWHFDEYKNSRFDRDFILKYLKKLITKKGILVGHSLGGLIGQEFAIEYPELVEKLFTIGYPLDNDCVSFKRTKADALSNRNKNEIELKDTDRKNSLLGDFLYHILFFLPLYGRLSVKKYFMVPGRTKADIFEFLLPYNVPERLKKVTVPVILINGTKDVYNKTISKDFDQLGKSYVIPGMSHQFFRYENHIAKIIKENI